MILVILVIIRVSLLCVFVCDIYGVFLCREVSLCEIVFVFIEYSLCLVVMF